MQKNGHDYEDFGGVKIHEYEDIDTVIAIAHFLNEHGELGAEVLADKGDVNSAIALMEECYQGEYESEEDFARYIISETMEVPDSLAYYIDYELFSKDLFMGNYTSYNIDDKTHVFSCC